eukprot:NODE_1616_length_1470_cov_52.710063_g1458_i0.p1 GENE.NODE_1616_length_1470_cov_52.710063_g1458_i0~~NODE_1616_length_1470_cov_52.710063_g1458_i0.p1  ORF type:complete len:464 (-),score=60.43 NODE_1616_length_1470_cov_52.710063_g1458_i0:77-1312(-)
MDDDVGCNGDGGGQGGVKELLSSHLSACEDIVCIESSSDSVDRYCWRGLRERSGHDYAHYRSLRNQLDDARFFNESERALAHLVQRTGNRELCRCEIVEMTVAAEDCDAVAYTPETVFINTFGVDLTEERALLQHLQCSSGLRFRTVEGSGRGDGLLLLSSEPVAPVLSAGPRSLLGSLATDRVSLLTAMQSDKDSALQQIRSAREANVRAIPSGKSLTVGIRTSDEHVQALVDLMKPTDVLAVDQRTGAACDLACRPGLILFLDDMEIHNKAKRISAFLAKTFGAIATARVRWEQCIVPNDPRTLGSECCEGIGSLPPVLLTRLWARVFYSSGAVAAVDVLCTTGPLRLTELLLVLQLRALPPDALDYALVRIGANYACPDAARTQSCLVGIMSAMSAKSRIALRDLLLG